MQIGSRSQVDPLIEFERHLLRILAKFGEVHTMAIGNEEIGKFMMSEIREHEHMMRFFSKLSEENGHMKPQQKKEYIKVYGKAAQIFEESLIAYLPKLISILLKKAKECQPDLHAVISDTLGMITFHTVQKAEDYETQHDLLQQVLKMPYQLLTKTTNKNAQAAGAQCLSKVIQNTRNELLWDNLDDIMEKIIQIFKSNGLRAHAALLESLITVIFHLEEEFAPFVDRFIPVLIEQISSSDWNVQKVGIDSINALTTTVQDQIIPHRVSILMALKPTRVHKMKPVREASQWTIKLLKESHPPLEGHELAILDENPQKSQASQRASIRDQKSPIRSKDALAQSVYVDKVSATPGQPNQPGQKGNFSQLVQTEQRKSGSQLQGRGRGGFSGDVEVQVAQPRGQSNRNNQDTSASEINPNCIDLSSQVQATGKKVSIATLKRRQKELESAKKNAVSQEAASRRKSAEKSKERKPLFQRLQNATFFKKEKADDEIQILEPKSGKPPLDLSRYNRQEQEPTTPSGQTVETLTSASSQQRKSKAQRNLEREIRRSRQESQPDEEAEDSGEDSTAVKVPPPKRRQMTQAEKKKEQELKNLRQFISVDEDQDSAIKIYEPKKRSQEAKLQVKDLAEDNEDDHESQDDEDRQQQSSIEVRKLEDDQASSDSDKIAWPTNKQSQPKDENTYADDDEDQIIWPTKKREFSWGQQQNQSKKSESDRKPKNNSNRPQQQNRYQDADENATDNNFMSDQEPQSTNKRNQQRFSKYSDYDIGLRNDNQTEQNQQQQNYRDDDHHSQSLQQTAAQFDQYAYQSLSESLQMALQQIEQLNRTVKVMSETMGKMQSEKNQLAQKVGGLEQLVLQLSVTQTQRSNFDGLKANVFEQSQTQLNSIPNFNKTLAGGQNQMRPDYLTGGNPSHMQSQQQQYKGLFDSIPGYSPQVPDTNPHLTSQTGINVPSFTLNHHVSQQNHTNPDNSSLNNAMKLMMQSQVALDNAQPQAKQSPMTVTDPFAVSKQSSFVGNSEANDQPKLQWSVVDGLLQKQMFDEAFMMILRQVSLTQQRGQDLNNDSMLLIKVLGKVGSFVVNQTSEPVKTALYGQLMEILACNEFIDFILSFMQEVISNYSGTLSPNLCLQVAQNLASLREQDLTRSLQSNQGSVMTMQQREAMEKIVKQYRARAETAAANSGRQQSQRMDNE